MFLHVVRDLYDAFPKEFCFIFFMKNFDTAGQLYNWGHSTYNSTKYFERILQVPKDCFQKNDFILNSACFLDSSFCNLLWQNLTLSVSLKRKSAVAFLPKKVSKIVPKIVKLFFFKYCPNFLKNEGVCLENPQSCYGPA